MIDRSFLDNIGWRGIRQRRVNLEKILRDAIEALHRAWKPVPSSICPEIVPAVSGFIANRNPQSASWQRLGHNHHRSFRDLRFQTG